MFTYISTTILYILFTYIVFCSCREQIKSVRHKYHLTHIRYLLGWLLPPWHISAWTREGLPTRGTLKLKSAKALKKSNQVINGVMNSYLLMKDYPFSF